MLVPAGPFTMGTDTEPWALDNERPAHVVDLPAFWIDTSPVTNGAYAAFVDAGGYDDPRWWSERGWAHRREAGLVAPQFWERGSSGDWWRRRFGVVEPVPPDEPVCTCASTRRRRTRAWAGKRLPTEAEWEKAARFDPATGRSRRYPWGDDDPTPAHANLGQRHLQPAPVGRLPGGRVAAGRAPADRRRVGVDQLGLASLPGLHRLPVSGVLAGVLRRRLPGAARRLVRHGPSAIRATFRNWDHPIRRQIFAGFRCAPGPAERHGGRPWPEGA